MRVAALAPIRPQSPTANGSGLKSERRQHRLPDGQQSRGFLAIELETVRAQLSLAALGLMVRIRDRMDDRETDGFIKSSALRALAIELEVEADFPRLLDELINTGLLERIDGGFQDVRFLVWCHSAKERETDREKWRGRLRDWRKGNKAGVTP
jgi:hypothetical protein